MTSISSDVHNVEKKKQILFIGYYLPPLDGSHSNRLLNFINYLDDFEREGGCPICHRRYGPAFAEIKKRLKNSQVIENAKV